MILWPEGMLPLGFALILGVIVGQAVQNEDLSPLSALVEGRQQLVDVLGIEVQQVAVGVRLADLREGSNGVGHDLKDGGIFVTLDLLSHWDFIKGL